MNMCIKIIKIQWKIMIYFIFHDISKGNGHERDFMNDDRVYIMDVYNRGIYPHDGFAKRKSSSL